MYHLNHAKVNKLKKDADQLNEVFEIEEFREKFAQAKQEMKDDTDVKSDSEQSSL